ncbi:MFS transporter [uncultured Anaerococcus sp.]|uniref:MFS transporter n=1 Tax=uncultured Anaerococcus sp. TaxID=293428 RepID=UPI002611995F|nr:glycoside-pentoside-hexuronide (GPH):cation symporter [uncultured Anaerococcus sp.]
MENKKIRPFSTKDQLGYIAGDMAGSFVNLTMDAFFLVFCTYVLKVDPKFMSGLFLFARLFDAINDPIIGSLPDRFSIGKSGNKFKPFIKIAMWPLALSILLGFFDITKLGFSTTATHIWVAFTYILYGMSYTGTSMPFGAMATVVTLDPTERSKLSAARAIGGTAIGYGFLSIIPMFIWDADKNPKPSGYMTVAIIAALGCIIGYYILCLLTQERYAHLSQNDSDPTKKYSFKEVIGQAFKNRAMVGIMFASIGSLIYITGNSQFGGFIFKEFYQAPKMQAVAMYAQLPITILMFFIVPKMQRKFGKRNLLLTMLAWNLVLSLFLFIKPLENVMTYIIINALANLGQVTFIMVVWAFVADAIDYHEYKFKSRNDGTLYSIYTFARKIGSTLASFGATAALAAIGFVATSPSQSPETIAAIRYLGTSIPLIACILEIIGMKFIWNLTKEDSEKIANDLRIN